MRSRKSIKYRGFTYTQAAADVGLFDPKRYDALVTKYKGKLKPAQLRILDQATDALDELNSDLGTEIDKIDNKVSAFQFRNLDELPKDLAKLLIEAQQTLISRCERFCSLFSDIEAFGYMSQEFDNEEDQPSAKAPRKKPL